MTSAAAVARNIVHQLRGTGSSFGLPELTDAAGRAETKLREYQLRGDAEIWRIHPYERTLIEIVVARTLRSIMEGSIPV